MLPLDAALRRVLELTPADDRAALMGARVRALMVGYDARWGKAPEWRPLDVERLYESDLWNPQTGRRSRTFTLAGIVDLLAETVDGLAVIDHKTTSDDISDPNSDYWRQLTVEGQLSHYFLLLWLNGMKPACGIWDVVRKPQIAPRQITKAEQKEFAVTGRWFGFELPDEIAPALGTGRETLPMYEARLIDDCTNQRPGHYFQRRVVPRLDAEVHEYAGELWDHGQDLVQVRATGRHVRNSGGCLMYGGACKFLGICSGHDTAESDRWRKREWVHNEIEPVEGSDGRGLLTNSRIRCFQTCRRKHHLQYEVGLERIDEEEREALVFGRLWHEGQAAYFNTIKENGNGSSITEPAIAVGCGTENAGETLLTG